MPNDVDSVLKSQPKKTEADGPLQGIDWGPDPDPVYSMKSNYFNSQFDKSRQLSREGFQSNGSILRNDDSMPLDQTLDGAVSKPYQNFINSQLGLKNEPHTAQNAQRNRPKMQTPMTEMYVGG